MSAARAVALLCCAVAPAGAAAGCGGGAASTTPKRTGAEIVATVIGKGTTSTLAATGGATMIALAAPSALRSEGGSRLREWERGKRLMATSGCLACHRIAGQGNPGPGPDLTQVGGRLPQRAIERTLVRPTAPMPSFSHMPRDERKALSFFLSQLRGARQ